MDIDLSRMVKWEYLSNALFAYFFATLLVASLDLYGIYLPALFGMLQILLTPLLLLAFTLSLSFIYFKFKKEDAFGVSLFMLFVLFCIVVLELWIGKAIEFEFSSWFLAIRIATILVQSAMLCFALSCLLPKEEVKKGAEAEKKPKKKHEEAGKKQKAR